MINLEEANDYTKQLFSVNWVQWIHEGTKPAETSSEKNTNILTSMVTNHCAICLNLNGCYFTKEKCPSNPLHFNCHCKTIDIVSFIPNTKCPIEKFTKYVFVHSIVDDKKQLFELWGYDIMDSEYLQKEFEKQAKLAYMTGNYELHKLDINGQRINIKIKIKKKYKNEYVIFYSGWMMYPNGIIILTTPYGGKIK